MSVVWVWQRLPSTHPVCLFYTKEILFQQEHHPALSSALDTVLEISSTYGVPWGNYYPQLASGCLCEANMTGKPISSFRFTIRRHSFRASGL